MSLTDVMIDFDRNEYPVITIGDQNWISKNLMVIHDPEGNDIISFAYKDDNTNVVTYGRLYTWDVAMDGSEDEEAQGICPCEWHIPDDEEFKQLEIKLGMTREEADMDNTWRGDDVGKQLLNGGTSGYNARLSGRRTSTGKYDLLNSYEYMWTSSEAGSYAWRRCLRTGDPNVGRWNTFPKSYAFSIRCVRDRVHSWNQ
jgi:uncharacterized protein (TIGR02145 family)